MTVQTARLNHLLNIDGKDKFNSSKSFLSVLQKFNSSSTENKKIKIIQLCFIN